MKLFRRSGLGAHGAATAAFTAPPPANPVEVGLALRAARERKGISLEQAREVTGVPKVDLEALERGRLELLHVEQAAVVGLWRYSELLGLDPGPLVGVIRTYWPQPALAVDAFYSEPGGAGMPVAQLKIGEGIIARIVPMARELMQGSVILGLSEATRVQLSAGSAHALLNVAVIGPVSRAYSARASVASAVGPGSPNGPAADLGEHAGLTEWQAFEAGVPFDRGGQPFDQGGQPFDQGGPSFDQAGQPDEPDEASRSFETGARHGEADPTLRAEGATGGDDEHHDRSWPGQVAHVVAERFGMDGDPVEDVDPDDTGV